MCRHGHWAVEDAEEVAEEVVEEERRRAAALALWDRTHECGNDLSKFVAARLAPSSDGRGSPVASEAPQTKRLGVDQVPHGPPSELAVEGTGVPPRCSETEVAAIVERMAVEWAVEDAEEVAEEERRRAAALALWDRTHECGHALA